MVERAKKSLLVQHEERFYIAHSKWPSGSDLSGSSVNV